MPFTTVGRYGTGIHFLYVWIDTEELPSRSFFCADFLDDERIEMRLEEDESCFLLEELIVFGKVIEELDNTDTTYHITVGIFTGTSIVLVNI
jgi:hypothetical protein